MKYLLIMLAVSALLMAVLVIGAVRAGEQATPRRGVVVICQVHELFTIFDTVVACDWRASGQQWYVKGCDGVDYWSDKAPRVLEVAR